jgi:biopolymer transport protein ExbD
MASIDAGGRSTGKRPVDANIPLVPFIDLLLCCVMFLLVTAVWNQLARVSVRQDIPERGLPNGLAEPELHFQLQITSAGYVFSSSAGDHIDIPRVGTALDLPALHEKLVKLRETNPAQTELALVVDDGVPFDSVVATMDTARGAGFPQLAL